jgi:hypothetical protein
MPFGELLPAERDFSIAPLNRACERQSSRPAAAALKTECRRRVLWTTWIRAFATRSCYLDRR